MSGPPTDTERLSTALSDRYVIESQLGQGGMATVYLARDVKHDREVALKVLRPELAALLGAERFLAEIKISARLDHPHILTLIDSGSAEGFLYYVLPYVRGGSLREKLNQEKQLGLDEAVAITVQVASALEYAHRHGVIHRDVKPENILFQEGEAMLADFGIALAVRAAGGNRLTESGLSLGTPQYMSPEQATGDRDLDARTDVYSLGAVLYEMLAGDPPVTGATVQAMIAKLMTERPTRLRVVRDTVPAGVDSAVAKALSKVPADRFRGTGEFAAALTAAMHARPGGAGRGLPRAWIGLAAILGITIGVWAVAHRGGPNAFVSPFTSSVPVPLTTSGNIGGGVLSPDGSQVAYTDLQCNAGSACRGDFVIRETNGQGVSTIVSQPATWAAPFWWSPDGRWVLFGMLDTEHGVVRGIYLVPQRGGAPRRISEAGFNFRGGFVAPDTLLVAEPDVDLDFTLHGPVWCRTIVASTGVTTDSLRLAAPRVFRGMAPSPDGRWIATLGARAPHDTLATISLFDRAGRATDSVPVVRERGNLSWTTAPDAVIVALGRENGATAVVRLRVDDRGRFLRQTDTLKVLDPDLEFENASLDGTALLLGQMHEGATEFWTATRTAPAAPFQRGHEIASSTGPLGEFMSPRGGWTISRQLTAAGSDQTRLAVQPFNGGAEHVLDPALNRFQDFAVSPGDDSIAITSREGSDSIAVTIYPIPTGRPVRRGVFSGVILDLEWLSNGDLVAPVDSGRTVRVIAADNSVSNIPVPDSIGLVNSLGRAPTRPAVAVTSQVLHRNRLETVISRLDLPSARFTVLARAGAVVPVSGAWWTSDGWIHVAGTPFGFPTARLYRVRETGGALETEPPVAFSPNASVVSLAHDDRRAVVSIQNSTVDLAILRANDERHERTRPDR